MNFDRIIISKKEKDNYMHNQNQLAQLFDDIHHGKFVQKKNDCNVVNLKNIFKKSTATKRKSFNAGIKGVLCCII